MSAPKGNSYWKRRSKHGRDKIFASPDLLWEAACEYFQWVDTHPWYRNEPIKSGEKAGTIVRVATARPYTLHALCLYLGVSASYFRNFKIEQTASPTSEGFLTVIGAIYAVIYVQKFEGAVVGAFNANVISRDLGSASRKENAIEKTTITVQIIDNE
jgi:hypothetical protein